MVEKPFTCDLPNCGKSFKQRVCLDVHKRGHSEAEKGSSAQGSGMAISDMLIVQKDKISKSTLVASLFDADCA